MSDRPEILLTRRAAVAGGLALGASVIFGCASAHQQTTGWAFVDDQGTKVALYRRPRRIVAYSTAAAALYGWGITPVGVFGEDPREDPALAGFPWDQSQVVGSDYGEIDLATLLSLKTDLVVSQWYPPPRDGPLFGFKDLAQQEEIRSRVPIVALNGRVIATRQIERFGQLAGALGADPASATIVRARAGFLRAGERLAHAAREVSNLRLIAVSGDESAMYVAKTADFGELSYYEHLGLPLVSARSRAPYWDAFPWADADRYPADGILYDARLVFLPLRDAREIRAFAALPAVKANQIAAWEVGPPPSYQAYARAMDNLAIALAGWRRLG